MAGCIGRCVAPCTGLTVRVETNDTISRVSPSADKAENSSDLEHHSKVVQSLRAELVAYKTHFGPIPPKNAPPRSSVKPEAKDRNRDDRTHKHERDTPSRGESKPPRGPSEKRDDRPSGSKSGERDTRRQSHHGHGHGHVPNGPKRDEDRDSKRRR